MRSPQMSGTDRQSKNRHCRGTEYRRVLVDGGSLNQIGLGSQERVKRETDSVVGGGVGVWGQRRGMIWAFSGFAETHDGAWTF